MSGKQSRKWQALGCVGAALAVSLLQSVWAGENKSKDPDDGMNRETGFWSQDVWADPARPFLFYGNERRQDERLSERGKGGSRPRSVLKRTLPMTRWRSFRQTAWIGRPKGSFCRARWRARGLRP